MHHNNDNDHLLGFDLIGMSWKNNVYREPYEWQSYWTFGI